MSAALRVILTMACAAVLSLVLPCHATLSYSTDLYIEQDSMGQYWPSCHLCMCALAANALSSHLQKILGVVTSC